MSAPTGNDAPSNFEHFPIHGLSMPLVSSSIELGGGNRRTDQSSVRSSDRGSDISHGYNGHGSFGGLRVGVGAEGSAISAGSRSIRGDGGSMIQFPGQAENGGLFPQSVLHMPPNAGFPGSATSYFYPPFMAMPGWPPLLMDPRNIGFQVGVQAVRNTQINQMAYQGFFGDMMQNYGGFFNSQNHLGDKLCSVPADHPMHQTTGSHTFFSGMHPTTNDGDYFKVMQQDKMIFAQGPMQYLLSQVSSVPHNLHGSQIPFPGTLGSTEVAVFDANCRTVQNQEVYAEDCEGDGEENDDEQDYHDADDEDSDGFCDEETTINCIPETTVCAGDVEKELEYEFYPVEVAKNGVITKRRRFPKGYEVPDYRPTRDVGAIEKAMRIGRRSPTAHIFEPKIGMVFDSRIEAYKFYNLYSWEVGFGVRFGSFAQNRVNKMRTMQKIVCERQGSDSREMSKSKRCRCKAMLQLHRTDDMGWYVSKHVTAHNHDLSVTCGEKREWNSHGKIAPPARKMIQHLRESNVSLTRVHCFMGNMYGSMHNIPFNYKTLRAVCSEIARDQKDDDIGKTMEIFRQMFEEDPGFQFCLDVDSEKRVKTLLWTTGRGRSQYSFFGDAITFDTTYCTNIYNMPFGMFVGVNNHFQSILFGGVLMKNEDTESFKWVFKEFASLMGGKQPVTILTDQCKAMTKAIKEVFSENTTHLWCKWHVLRTAPQELGPLFRKNLEFQKEFSFVISQMLTIDEFERGWADLVKRYELEENEFMQRTYAKRAKWAKPWARGIFCARMASTQRSESANSLLKKIAPRNACMNRFVQQYRKMEFLRARAEQKAEHQTKQFVHRTKRMYAIEEHALNVYTRNSFLLFSEEVDKSANYVVKEGEEEGSYFVIHNRPERRKGWARVVFYVTVEEDGKRYCCECGQYEHFGILCCHAIKVMINTGIREIPEEHIMKRWTRTARDSVYPEPVNKTERETLGQNLMFANALDVVQSTEKSLEAEKILLKHLNNAKQEIAAVKNLESMNMEITDGEAGPGWGNMFLSDSDSGFDTGYESNGQRSRGNNYGASGCSAYMSDADIRSIQAPTVPPKTGRPRETRFKSVFGRKKRGYKKYTANTEVLAPADKIKKPRKTNGENKRVLKLNKP